MNIPHWDKLSIEDRRTYVRGFFINGKIKKATREQLEDYLITMANAPYDGKREYQEEQERFSVAIRHLLQTRISEDLHRKSMRLSIAAIIISFLSLVYAVWKPWYDHYCISSQARSALPAKQPTQPAAKNDLDTPDKIMKKSTQSVEPPRISVMAPAAQESRRP
jgi:hypothetical protein